MITLSQTFNLFGMGNFILEPVDEPMNFYHLVLRRHIDANRGERRETCSQI